MVTRPAITALATLLLSACTVGPDHVKPDAQAPAAFSNAVAGAPAAAPDVEFWKSFDDAGLDELVDAALVANHDLRIALANWDRANAGLRGARFDPLPVVTANARAADTRSSADQLPGLTRGQRDRGDYSAGVGASWELDLFGRVRRGVEAARADAEATAADLAAAQVAIVGEVARTYFDLRGAQARLRVARANADNQRETVKLVQARFEVGNANEFDASRAHAQLATTESRIPALESQIAFSMHRLAVLTARAPAALVAELEGDGALPALPARIDAGTPGDLLRRRPDVAAAEQRLHAATARIGIATADLFPRFTLGALVGAQAIDRGALFDRDSRTGFVALGVDWSFLDVGHVRARIAASGADAEGELARYEQTVLRALEDAENALVAYARAREQEEKLRRAAADGGNAARLARARFDAGVISLLEVLDAERGQLEAEDAFAAARAKSASDAAALYTALAGGWPTKLPQRKALAANG